MKQRGVRVCGFTLLFFALSISLSLFPSLVYLLNDCEPRRNDIYNNAKFDIKLILYF